MRLLIWCISICLLAAGQTRANVDPLHYLESFETCGRTPIFEPWSAAGAQKKAKFGQKEDNFQLTNGIPVRRGEYPSYAALYDLEQKYASQPPLCGAVLIGPRLVLTAAHCVETTRKPFKVVLGLYDRLGQNASDVSEMRARSWCVHELRNQAPHSNDLAVVYLDRPAKYRNTVQPACLFLASPNQTLFQTKQTDEFILTGLGYRSRRRDADRLYKAYFKYFYPTGAKTDDSPGSTIVRATERFTQACQGDSGSPLYYYRDSIGRDRISCRDDFDLKHFVSGVVSRGTLCDNDNFAIEYRANLERQEAELLYILKQVIVMNEQPDSPVPKNCYISREEVN